MFLAQGLIQPGSGPNRLPTSVIPSPATCSVEGLKDAACPWTWPPLPSFLAACPASSATRPASPARYRGGRRAPTPQRSPSLALPRSAPRQDARPPWPAGRACRRRIPAAFEPPLSLLCTVVSSPVCAAPFRLRRPAAAALGSPPACCATAAACSQVAKPPRAASGQAEATCGCGLIPPCFHAPQPPPVWPPPARTAKSRRPLCSRPRHGPRAAIRQKERAFLQNL